MQLQPHQDLCLIMLKARGLLHNLDLTDTASRPHHIKNQLIPLQQLGLDLDTAATEINPAQFADPPMMDTSHVKLINCFAALVSALVVKLSQLEESPASRIPADPTNFSSMAAQFGFHLLHAMLVNSCCAVLRWPCCWPLQDHVKNTCVRTALHSLLCFLLRITRGNNTAWHAVMGKASPEKRRIDLVTIAFVPKLYIQGINEWPLSDLEEEISALPVEFFSLLICLTLEQLEDPPSGKNAATAVCSDLIDASTSVKAWTHSQPTLHLGQTLNSLSASLTKTGPSKMMCRLFTPAMLQLQKRIMIVLSDSHHSHQMEWFLVRRTQKFLKKMLGQVNIFNDLAAKFQSSVDTCLDQGDHPASSLYRPAVAVSDALLLRSLFLNMPTVSADVLERYQLISAVMQGWRADSHQNTLFPGTPIKDQVGGCYVVTHHCMCMSLAWMRQQQKQTSQMYAARPLAESQSQANQIQLAEMQEICNLGHVNNAVLSRLRNSDFAEGGW